MSDPGHATGRQQRTATCACGALRVATSGEPVRVHACCCLNCQRETGSAFSYTAFFPETAATIGGEFRRWAQGMGSGQGGENCFCPTCGTRVFMRLEGLAGLIGISAGCFADPAFPPPSTIYWWCRHHHWLAPPADIARVDTQ